MRKNLCGNPKESQIQQERRISSRETATERYAAAL